MENSRATIAALLFILAVVGINFVMYGVVRGLTRGGGKGPLETMMKALNPKQQTKNDDIDELRRTMQELNKDKDNPTRDSE